MRKRGDIQIFPGGLSPGPRHDNDESNDFGAADDNASFGVGGGGNEDWGGDDNDGVGFQLNNDEPMEDAGNVNDEETKDEEETAANAMKKDKPKPKVVQDPWALLDLHEPSKDKAAPLRIGVTTRLPPELEEDDRPSAAVTGSRTRTKKTTSKKKMKNKGRTSAKSAAYDFQSRPYLADITLDEAMRDDDDELDNSDESLQVETNRNLQFLRTKNGLIFGDEFAYIAKAHAKHRDAIRKQQRLQQHGAAQEEKNSEPNIMDYDDDDENDDYFGGGDDDSFGHQEDNNNEDNRENRPIHRSNVDFNAIDDVFASSGGGGGGFDNDDFNDDFANNSQSTFEDLCRAHLRRFAKSAEKYAAETQLTKRVGAWQEGLAPLLEEQEQRPEFDIHSCGRHILEKVERKLSVRKRTSTGDKKLESSQNNTVAFATIFSKDCEEYEVCRLFLSTLMLCNCRNIEMHTDWEDGDAVESMDSLKIELLNSTFAPPMDTFIAPSAGDSCQNDRLGEVDENS